MSPAPFNVSSLFTIINNLLQCRRLLIFYQPVVLGTGATLLNLLEKAFKSSASQHRYAADETTAHKPNHNARDKDRSNSLTPTKSVNTFYSHNI